jgi:hypothetical protein
MWDIATQRGGSMTSNMLVLLYNNAILLLFSVYIGCFTATAKIIREIVDILIHYNSIRNNAG